MLKIRLYDPTQKLVWDNFLENCKNGTFLLKRDFMDYHKSKFDDFSMMIYRGSKLIALVPANIDLNNVYSHQGLTYGGILIHSDSKFIEYLEIFTEVLTFLKKKFIASLSVKQIPTIYNLNFNDELDYLSFVTDSESYRKDVLSVINLQDKFKISKDRINGYKRGVKNLLEVREVHDFNEFWNELLIPNLSKKYSVTPVHSLGEIGLLKSRFKNNIRQFNVYKENEIVAGTTIFQTKNVVHVQYTASNSKKNILGSLDFLFYKLITDIYSNHKYFDFGTSNERDGKKINQGLLYWKEGFGARSLIQNFYKFDVSSIEKIKSLFL
jgi:hypothetical protein